MSETDPNAPLRADNNPKFYARFKWLGLGAIAFALYCVYDGAISYPDQRVRGEALLQLADERMSNEQKEEIHNSAHGGQEMYLEVKQNLFSDSEAKQAWLDLAEEKGWSTEPPSKLRTEMDSTMQYIMAGMCLAIAAWMLATVWRSHGRWIELADGEVRTSWGQSFPLSSVTQIDKKQWRDKGIARVKYNHEGRRGKFVVDDYKFHRKTTDEIMLRIEQAAGIDKIVNGRPELTPEEAAAAEADLHEVESHESNGQPNGSVVSETT